LAAFYPAVTSYTDADRLTRRTIVLPSAYAAKSIAIQTQSNEDYTKS